MRRDHAKPKRCTKRGSAPQHRKEKNAHPPTKGMGVLVSLGCLMSLARRTGRATVFGLTGVDVCRRRVKGELGPLTCQRAAAAQTAHPAGLRYDVPTDTPIPLTCHNAGAHCNPWGYTFAHIGRYNYNPPSDFCSYFNCIASFWDSTNGNVDECSDRTYSHSGGERGAGSRHGGNCARCLRPSGATGVRSRSDRSVVGTCSRTAAVEVVGWLGHVRCPGRPYPICRERADLHAWHRRHHLYLAASQLVFAAYPVTTMTPFI